MVVPVHIFINRQELLGFSDLRLRRAKDEMTGDLSMNIFMSYVPSEPYMIDASKGREVLVYIGGHLAFTGSLDRRTDSTKIRRSTMRNAKGQFVKGSGKIDSGGAQITLGPTAYEVNFSARGMTKYLIDSSHYHPTCTMLRPTNRFVFEDLVTPWSISLDWQATEIDLDKVRLRDGGRVGDELAKISEMTSLWAYETTDGKLRIVDGTEAVRTGESLVLGTNILSFATTQSEDTERKEIRVKGQRIEKEQWGDPAVIPTESEVADGTVDKVCRATVQLYGNGTQELLQRRASYEANKRASLSKRVELDVFHIQQTTGEPWDIGVQHYVEIPPAGIYGTFEVTELNYMIDANNTLKTSLVLTPPPSAPSSGSSTGFMAGAPEPSDTPSKSANAEEYKWWAGTELTVNEVPSVQEQVASYTTDKTTFLSAADTSATTTPPTSLPAGYRGGEQ